MMAFAKPNPNAMAATARETPTSTTMTSPDVLSSPATTGNAGQRSCPKTRKAPPERGSLAPNRVKQERLTTKVNCAPIRSFRAKKKARRSGAKSPSC
jgi:hypothetical protein